DGDCMASTRSLRSKLNRLEALVGHRQAQDTGLLQLLGTNPMSLMLRSGMTPDLWQANLLRSHAERVLLLCCRQAGKSTIAAALGLHRAMLVPRSPVLLLSPSLRQSSELFRKVRDLFNALGRPIAVAAES